MKLDTLSGESTRPTADRVKESLFNILAQKIPGCDFADVFSGTGSIGCEALSRRAAKVTFIDYGADCRNVIVNNIKKVEGNILADKAIVYCENYKSALIKIGKQDIIFLDPPYSKNLGAESLEIISQYDILKDNGMAVLEHDFTEEIPGKIGNLSRYDTRKYGRAVLSFYRKDIYTDTE